MVFLQTVDKPTDNLSKKRPFAIKYIAWTEN